MACKNPYAKLDDTLKRIMKAAFPEWKGHDVELVVHNNTIDLASDWSGGTRESFAFVRLSDFKSAAVPSQSVFGPQIGGLADYQMVPGVLVVAYLIYRGKRMRPRIYVHPDDVNQMALPAPAVELDVIHALCLLATRMYISSARYGEFRDWTNATKVQYEAIRKDLQSMGLLSKGNSLTVDGRNVVEKWKDEYALLRTYGIEPVEYLKKVRGW